MEAQAQEIPVARKNAHGGKRPGAGRPKTSERDDATVKMDRLVVARCRYIAEMRGISLAQYLTEGMRPVSDADWARIEKAREPKPEETPAKKPKGAK